MKKIILIVIIGIFAVVTWASAYEVTRKYDDGDAVYYTLSCNGGTAKIKYLKINGGWYVAGTFSSNHNYGNMDSAAKIACKYAK